VKNNRVSKVKGVKISDQKEKKKKKKNIIYLSSGEDALGSFDVISETSAGTSDATITK
jgi:hypothetical protein